jgi:hypothetical protein
MLCSAICTAATREVRRMKSDYLPQSRGLSREQPVSKAYVGPAVTPVSPEEAKKLLLREADIGDPQVRLMLERIDTILGEEPVH